jgi:2-phospho-L-lactate guanylyltransferase
MKAFGSAKTRLRGPLTDEARANLAHAMFEHVVATARQCPEVHRVYVVTNCDHIAALTGAAGGFALRDPVASAGLGALIDWALKEIATRAVTRAVVLMSDLPLVQPADIGQLCRLLDEHDRVVVPDRRGQSTNALALHLPLVGATAFGRADSYAAHRAMASALGLKACELVNPRLAHDIDIVEDLDLPSPTLATMAAATHRVAGRHQDW